MESIYQYYIKELPRESVREPHRFQVISSWDPNMQEVKMWQRRAGYHPDGYGFYNLTKEKIGEFFKVEWQCSHSCE